MLFSVKDLKTGEYDRPFPASSFDEAKRMLDLLFRNDSRSLIVNYPQDFILVLIGDFNKDNGEVQGCDHEVVCNLSEIANQYKNIDVPNFKQSLTPEREVMA